MVGNKKKMRREKSPPTTTKNASKQYCKKKEAEKIKKTNLLKKSPIWRFCTLKVTLIII